MSTARRMIKARIADDLLSAIEREMPRGDYREDKKFMALCQRIQGKVVDLVFSGPDAFEARDDDYLLPTSCWVEVAQEETQQQLAALEIEYSYAKLGLDELKRQTTPIPIDEQAKDGRQWLCFEDDEWDVMRWDGMRWRDQSGKTNPFGCHGSYAPTHYLPLPLPEVVG